MFKKKEIIIGGTLIIISIVFLAILGLKSSAVYYYEVNEFLAQESSLEGKTVRVEGKVSPDVEREIGMLRFKIVDISSQDATLQVVYQGLVPDTFNVGHQVVVEGRYTPQRVFEATRIITKCPSKYQAVESLGN